MNYVIKYKNTLFCFLLSALFLINCSAKDTDNALKDTDNALTTTPLPDSTFHPVFNYLKRNNVDSNFLNKYLNDTNLKFNEKYIKINVTGYLKSPDYSWLYDAKSVSQSKEFLKNHLQILLKAEEKYGVPKEIIVAILKVETRFGEILGNNHLPSVFFSTALVNEPEYIKLNNKVIDDLPDTSNKSALKQKVLQRSKKKSDWALKELIAISKIEHKYGIDFNNIYGSWAGAFGISQFLPSSFLNSAVDGNGDGIIDLFNLEDAIFSVGNYLKNYKWNTFENKKKAVYSYNNSNDYAVAVIKLSEKLLIKK